MNENQPKIILFSPLGDTDPIRNFHDGAMLHIARHYKPDIIYLYLTREINDIDEKDNRYEKSIKLLGKKIGREFIVKKIIDNEMLEPHKFVFFEKFNKYLDKIEKENNDTRILLNISSGTPAIKSTLQVIASFNKSKYESIQVASPSARSNKGVPHDDKEDLETLWEYNIDNKDNENRCEPPNDYIFKLILIENAKKLLDEYDYNAAYMIIEKNNICDNKVCKLLSAAKARLDLDFSSIDKMIDSDEKKYFYASEDGSKKLLIEYILILKIRINKKFYPDFIRAITPLNADLFEQLLKKYKIDIDKLISEKPKNDIILKVVDTEKVKQYDIGLYEYLNEEYISGFKNADLSTDNMLKIIEYYSKNGKIKHEDYAIANNLRNIEKKIRNIAAHEIVSITDEKINNLTGYNVEQIFKEIIKCAKIVGINIDDKILNSYYKMNDYIKNKIIGNLKKLEDI